MPNKKITGLPPTASVKTTDLYEKVDGVSGVSERALISQLRTNLGFDGAGNLAVGIAIIGIDGQYLIQGINKGIAGDGTAELTTVRTKKEIALLGTSAVPASASNRVQTNEGQVAEIILTLPTAVAGLMYSFIVQAAFNLRITANAGDTIRIGPNVSAVAGNIVAATVGNSVTLVAINATEWMALSSIGTWTVT